MGSIKWFVIFGLICVLAACTDETGVGQADADSDIQTANCQYPAPSGEEYHSHSGDAGRYFCNG